MCSLAGSKHHKELTFIHSNRLWLWVFALIGFLFQIQAPLAEIMLEPWTYGENFEGRTLAAWASYPIWQDTAFDQNFRIDTIVPKDSNISLVQKVTPYTAVDAYAGAQKQFDIYLVPGSTVSLSYYIKTHHAVSSLAVRLAAGAR